MQQRRTSHGGIDDGVLAIAHKRERAKKQADVDRAGFIEFMTPNVAQRQPGKADAQRLEAPQQPMLDKREVDVEQNGLALRSLHHKVFDLGAFTIRPSDYVMVFSQHLVGNAENLLSYHGAGIQLPQSSSYLPSAEFLDWHEDQVFKKPGRDAV